MRKLKLFLSMLMLIAFSVGNVWAETAEFSYSDLSGQGASGSGADFTGATKGDVFMSGKGNGNTSYVQIYANGTLTFTPLNGATITKIVLEATTSGYVKTWSSSPEGASVSDKYVTWEGSSTSVVTLTNTASGQARIKNMTVTYTEGSGTPTCATPTFSPEAGSYEGTQNVTISSTAGATIYYTTDDSDPTTSGTRQTYSSPIAVSADMTIKAYAVKAEYDDSEVAEAAYEITEGPDVTIAFEGNTDWNIPAGSSSKTVDEGTYTDGTYTIKIAGSTGEGYYINGYLLLGKTGAYVELPEFSNPVEKIVVVGTSGGSTGVKFNIYDGTTAVSTEVTGCKNVSQEFTIETPEANKAYKVQVTSNANLQISAIKIYYGAAPAVAKPTISGETPFLNTTEVTISIPEGATVYYTTDGSTPTDASTKYSAPFTLDASATVKAIAKNGSDYSAVAEKAFTKATVITVTEAIAAIPNKDDVVDNQYVSGIVCTAGTLAGSGKMTYYISDDGSETSRLQIYKGKNLNNADFTAVSDLAIGDRVVVFGQLKNYNNTPEMNDGNYLVSKADPAVAAPTFSPDGGGFMGETDVTISCATAGSVIYYTLDESAPSKLSTLYESAIHLAATTTINAIAYVGDDASLVISKTFTLTAPMTVAEALTALDSEDPINNVAVAGIISTAPTSNPSSGKLTYYISNDGSATDQLEVFNGYGLNGASFSAKTDLQVGDEVTVFGNLTIFNSTTKEFASGSRLLAFNRPVVPVSSVELASAATVKVGNSINLSASVLPANATDKVIEWSIQSGNDNITLDNGAVTGVAEGTAVVRATSHADNTKYAECTITIEAADPTYAYYFYGKVTETAGIEDGQYLIVYEDESVAFNGGLETLDAANNTIAVEIEDGLIVSNATTDAASFTIGVTAGTIQAAMGDYIGVTSYSNGLKQNADATTYPAHSFSIDEEENAIVSLNDGWSGTMILNYNTGASDKRFRYYKNGSQKKIQLYKRFGTDVAPKANPQLAWDPADDIEITVGDEFTAPTLTYVEGFDGVAAVAIESDNTDLAIVTAGVVSLVADATGEANITATFAGNDNYKAATASYKITVNASVVPTPAVSGNVVIIAEYESKFYAMTNSLTSGALAGVEVEKDGSKIVVSSAEDKAAIQWTATVDGDNTTLKDGDDYYIKGSSGASLSLEADPYNWNWDGEKSCYISSAYTNRGLFFSNSGNVFKGYALSNITSDGYAATEVIEIDPEDIVISSKVSAELAYDPESDEITQGDAWSAPSLVNPHSVTITSYASDNEAVATVTDGGVIALAGGIGTAVITAHFDGDASYLEGDAVYTITVNAPAPTPSGTSYVKVTSTADITADGEYLLVNENALKAFNGNLETLDAEGNTVDVVISGGKIAGTSAIDAAIFTIDASNGNLRSHSGHYVGVGGYSNGLAQSDEAGTYANVFAINASENVDITITFTGGDMHLLYNTANRFRYYKAENQTNKAIQLYKKESSTPEPEYETVRGGLTAGNYYTICLPKKVVNFRGASIWNLEKRNTAETEVYLEEAQLPFVAGTPFIIQATAATLEVVYEGDVTETPVESGALRGTLVDLDIDAFDALPGNIYILKNNAIRPRKLGENFLSANRAYIDYDELVPVSVAPTSMPGKKVKRMPMQGQTTTDCELINAAEAPVKMMINGQLFILRGEKMYDTTGRLVK